MDKYKKVVTTNPATGLPEVVEVSSATLVDTVLSDPDIALNAIRTALERDLATRTRRRSVLPLETPITQMMSPARATTLTDAARKLTKEDLLDLGGWGGNPKSPRELGLDAEDIISIRGAFAAQLTAKVPGGVIDVSGGLGRPGGRPGPIDLAAVDVSCCCCTPCCCAATALKPSATLV